MIAFQIFCVSNRVFLSQFVRNWNGVGTKSPSVLIGQKATCSPLPVIPNPVFSKPGAIPVAPRERSSRRLRFVGELQRPPPKTEGGGVADSGSVDVSGFVEGIDRGEGADAVGVEQFRGAEQHRHIEGVAFQKSFDAVQI